MPTVSIRQYTATDPLQLSGPMLRDLLGPHRRHIDVIPSGAGEHVLRANRYVGVVRLPELDVVMTPKVSPLAVLWMMGYVNGVALRDIAWAGLAREQGLLEVVARLFAGQVRELIHRGLYQEYVERDETLAFVRGRVLMLETLRQGRGLSHRPTCRHAEMTTDTAVNQSLRNATEILMRLSYGAGDVTGALDRNLRLLIEAGVSRTPNKPPPDEHLNRLNAHYHPALGVARLIMEHATLRLEAGTVQSPAFLVNMDSVFQAYVGALLRRQAEALGLQFRSEPTVYLDTARTVKIRPDIVLLRAGRAAIVADAKYKLTTSEDNFYQALAYAKALDLRRVALVYPDDGEVEPAIIRVRHDGTEVLVRTLPVGRGHRDFIDLDQRAASAALSLLTELTEQVDVAAA